MHRSAEEVPPGQKCPKSRGGGLLAGRHERASACARAGAGMCRRAGFLFEWGLTGAKNGL
jgi:hypothetical protein